jgi:hypothetical protein
MEELVERINWLDTPETWPWLVALTDVEKAAAIRWLFWQVYHVDPEATSRLLAQLQLDWGYFKDHETWRSAQ